MKFIYVLILSIIFNSFSASAEAMTNGLLHGKTLYIGNDAGSINSTTTLLTDGDETTGVPIQHWFAHVIATDAVWYEFSTPQEIGAIKIKADSFVNWRLKFITHDGTLKFTNFRIDGSIFVLEEPVQNVRYVVFENMDYNAYANVYEFEVFSAPVYSSVEDVKNLQVHAKYDSVKLSWINPDNEFFHHVKIYRKKVEQQSFWDQLFGTTAVSAETTSDGYTPMFETNGTYWTDLTVTPETTYSYKVTSVNIEGDESQGVTVETTTPSEPVPVLAGVATTQNENGDYVVTWTSPTKGIVKVLIDGKEYAQVDAATKQIVIKKEEMKTDFFGAYAAKLIPIGEYGTKGQAVNVPSLGGKIDFPLSFQDFIETTISILAWVAPFILLSLMFIFWKPIFNFIKKAISERRVKQ
ncbi:hypothetical protein [Anoxybacillus flavithermus]|uniref:Uncharacterized conserved protein, containing bacterial Ig-like protein n=1 Tax=Anoxybacillus flavithermus (strain DSM 21510 / WK1) TaxID=491915 RepID=B7GK87_ANOFW|nr:hypothetical protein [Anoxybacillus flavithermus]ACJ33172.1 Uncharacterized conserved protein, containing bacterial Ig-like protein [Anoxybacillus flavithermus WK1]